MKNLGLFATLILGCTTSAFSMVFKLPYGYMVTPQGYMVVSQSYMLMVAPSNDYIVVPPQGGYTVAPSNQRYYYARDSYNTPRSQKTQRNRSSQWADCIGGKHYPSKKQRKVYSSREANKSADMYQLLLDAGEAQEALKKAKRSDCKATNEINAWLSKEQECLNCIYFSLKYSANPNYRPKPTPQSGYGKPVPFPTLLMLAARYGYTDLVSQLLKKGARIDAHVRGTTALVEAITHDQKEVVELLIDKGARIDIGPCDMTAVHEAIRLRKPHMLSVLLAKRKSAANIMGKFNYPPLLQAINRQFTDGALILIDEGAEVNANELDLDRKTPLYRAVELEEVSVVRELVHSGAKQVRFEDNTPIDLAASKGSAPLMELLLPLSNDV